MEAVEGRESISDIARALQESPGSIHGMLEATGGIGLDPDWRLIASFGATNGTDEVVL